MAGPAGQRCTMYAEVVVHRCAYVSLQDQRDRMLWIVLSSCSICTCDNRSVPMFGRPWLPGSQIYRSNSSFFIIDRFMCFDSCLGRRIYYFRSQMCASSCLSWVI
ncbi:hypothetical protein VPH35_066417 [Triticum aestivum]